MATYIDYHPKLPSIPSEVAKQMAATVRAGKRNEFGVKPINVFIGKGEGWCVTDAADPVAVVKSHKAQGIPLRKSDVHQVQPLV